MEIDDMIALVQKHQGYFNSRARALHIDPLALRCQTMLHLPRPDATLLREATVAEELLVSQSPPKDWMVPPEGDVELDDLEFIVLSPDIARIYHEQLHYVRSYRPGEHFALRHKGSGKIACMGSVADFDLKHVGDMLPACNAMMFSRFYAFRWAPANTFSYFVGKLRPYLIKEHNTELIVTFINPNLGFTAGSHKAAQLFDLAIEKCTRYMYLDGRYQTMRYFVENHGTSDPLALKAKLGNSFQVSNIELHPLRILANPLQKRVHNLIPAKPYVLSRPNL